MFYISVISLCWLALLIINPLKFSPFMIKNWYKFGAVPINLILKIDNLNWPISFAYMTILLSYLLTSVVHLQGNTSLYSWIQITVIIIVGWVVILADDYWTVLIAWIVLDFIEFLIGFRYKSINPDFFFKHFLWKLIGSMLLVYAISTSFLVNPFILFEKRVEGVGIILLAAVFLHSGILTFSFGNNKKNKN
ncbi:MAG: hypothetical protein J7L66_03010, partial [Anaerolineaceae bacterium]|nr:hypothetical protein [Anaerolineaceae bacterium]